MQPIGTNRKQTKHAQPIENKLKQRPLKKPRTLPNSSLDKKYSILIKDCSLYSAGQENTPIFTDGRWLQTQQRVHWLWYYNQLKYTTRNYTKLPYCIKVLRGFRPKNFENMISR